MFDKKRFAQILKNINETYSNQRDFSKKSEINRTYLSQYMNMKLDKPPKPEILQKLSNSSNGITTYYELMSVCDYIRTQDLFSDEINPSLAESYREAFIEYGISSEDVLLIENLSKSKLENKDKEIANILNKYPSKTLEKLFSTLDICRQNLSPDIELARPLKAILKKIEEDYIPKNAIPISDKNIVEIPLIGVVRAGYNYMAQENWIGTVDIDKKLAESGDFFALKVKGDSMVPAFFEDDIVIIRKQSDCENNQFAVVIVNGDEGTLKKVKKTDEGIVLQPINPAYGPVMYTNKEIKETPIIIAGVFQELRRTQLKF